MLSVLLEGTLTAAPVRRISSKEQTFATAQMRCAGEDGQAVFCSVIAFNADAVEALLTLSSGDAVAVAGEAALNHWETNSGEHRFGLRVTAQRVLTVYAAGTRRRSAGRSARQGSALASEEGDR